MLAKGHESEKGDQAAYLQGGLGDSKCENSEDFIYFGS